ncbi:hypothetical protein CF327_g6618 [Tilletia walkeri]|nr:hypothetical protein CF327_g6618 [Tilletia walkeri]
MIESIAHAEQPSTHQELLHRTLQDLQVDNSSPTETSRSASGPLGSWVGPMQRSDTKDETSSQDKLVSGTKLAHDPWQTGSVLERGEVTDCPLLWQQWAKRNQSENNTVKVLLISVTVAMMFGLWASVGGGAIDGEHGWNNLTMDAHQRAMPIGLSGICCSTTGLMGLFAYQATSCHPQYPTQEAKVVSKSGLSVAKAIILLSLHGPTLCIYAGWLQFSVFIGLLGFPVQGAFLGLSTSFWILHRALLVHVTDCDRSILAFM